MAGIKISQYQGWDGSTSVDESRVLDDTTSFDENADVSELLNYIFNTTSSLNYFELVASWESDPIDLHVVGRIQDSVISWAATTPEGTHIAVYTSLYDGDWWEPWQAVENDSSIPGLTLEQNVGRDLSHSKIRFKIECVTSNITLTPNITELVIKINSQKILRLAPNGNIQFAGTMTQSAQINL